jgi:hypothetical protein
MCLSMLRLLPSRVLVATSVINKGKERVCHTVAKAAVYRTVKNVTLSYGIVR